MGIELRPGSKTYLFSMTVPADVRAALGRRMFRVSLRTDSRSVAEGRAAIHRADWKAKIEAARGNPKANDATYWRARRKGRSGAGGPALRDDSDPAVWRRRLAEATTPTERDETLEMIDMQADDIAFLTIDYGQRLSESREATEFYAAATAIETTAYVDEWLSTARTAPKTQDMARADVTRFALAFPTVGRVERLAVRAWVNGLMQGEAGLSPKTVARQLGAIRGYWRYLEGMGAVEEGRAPFDRLDIARQVRREGTREKRRPFAPADIVKLRTAAVAGRDDMLADLIEMAMWTGCRIEELCSLKVSDVDPKAGSITVRDGKTEAASRVVPMHSALRPLVATLIGERRDGWLLARLTPNKYADRSNAIGKRFGRLRSAEGFGPDVVFHSIRKTVATLLENAGVSENLAADILGHEKPRITYGLYSGGASLAVKQAAIEKLAYPE